MSTDTEIRLAPAARLGDVANVIGILLGCEKRLEPLGGDSFSCRVDGIKFSKIDSLPECVSIHITPKTGVPRTILYHFEYGGVSKGGYYTKIWRGMMPSSTAVNIALGVGLVKFFGGEVDFNDCDDTDIDFKSPECKDIRANDGVPWDTLQRRMFAIEPLSELEIKKYSKVAAYGDAR